jgi:hypothetical protein
MSGTRRIPLGRSPGMQITPKAIELFRELERAHRARKRGPPDCRIGGPQDFCIGECRACRAWWDAHAALHTELNRELWDWPCLPHCPVPPGTPRAREWHPGRQEQELWNLLDKARRAATAAKRTASARKRKQKESTNAGGDESSPST